MQPQFPTKKVLKTKRSVRSLAKQRAVPTPQSSLAERAEEFLNSGTPASYATGIALALVILSGVAVIATVAPGLSILARGYRRSNGYSNLQLNGAVQNLKRHHYIEAVKDPNGTPRIQLTKKGEAHFQKMLFEDVSLPHPPRWDGKWRFVLFDIPLEHTKAREALRWRLKALGFYQYQKSVWVYPHACEKEILYVADFFGVGKFVEILEVTHLSNDKELKKHFEL
ncbi:MAG: hypothetical protein HYT94_02860 [Parcubacteria group bacterium]|nr:hypothetical protein [Parcubacteria group bacterium]